MEKRLYSSLNVQELIKTSSIIQLSNGLLICPLMTSNFNKFNKYSGYILHYFPQISRGFYFRVFNFRAPWEKRVSRDFNFRAVDRKYNFVQKYKVKQI